MRYFSMSSIGCVCLLFLTCLMFFAFKAHATDWKPAGDKITVFTSEGVPLQKIDAKEFDGAAVLTDPNEHELGLFEATLKGGDAVWLFVGEFNTGAEGKSCDDEDVIASSDISKDKSSTGGTLGAGGSC